MHWTSTWIATGTKRNTVLAVTKAKTLDHQKWLLVNLKKILANHLVDQKGEAVLCSVFLKVSRAIWSMYERSKSPVCFTGSKSDIPSACGTPLTPLSQVLFLIFMDIQALPNGGRCPVGWPQDDSFVSWIIFFCWLHQWANGTVYGCVWSNWSKDWHLHVQGHSTWTGELSTLGHARGIIFLGWHGHAWAPPRRTGEGGWGEVLLDIFTEDATPATWTWIGSR